MNEMFNCKGGSFEREGGISEPALLDETPKVPEIEISQRLELQGGASNLPPSIAQLSFKLMFEVSSVLLKAQIKTIMERPCNPSQYIWWVTVSLGIFRDPWRPLRKNDTYKLSLPYPYPAPQFTPRVPKDSYILKKGKIRVVSVSCRSRVGVVSESCPCRVGGLPHPAPQFTPRVPKDRRLLLIRIENQSKIAPTLTTPSPIWCNALKCIYNSFLHVFWCGWSFLIHHLLNVAPQREIKFSSFGKSSVPLNSAFPKLEWRNKLPSEFFPSPPTSTITKRQSASTQSKKAKKLRETTSGQAAIKQKKIKYEEMLFFLNPYIGSVDGTASNYNESSPNRGIEEENNEEKENEVDNSEESPEIRSSVESSNISSHSQKQYYRSQNKRKRSQEPETS
ncbi:hypothetical protein ABEB36_014518 [Hypothenemus hampei]|uniref:Uncharacterized protein n=1 Tax=Hypothenemus hampei TaxID=57062 RepID=A0ABD1E4S4_HYPHA